MFTMRIDKNQFEKEMKVVQAYLAQNSLNSNAVSSKASTLRFLLHEAYKQIVGQDNKGLTEKEKEMIRGL